jgi:hypothetical protein
MLRDRSRCDKNDQITRGPPYLIQEEPEIAELTTEARSVRAWRATPRPFDGAVRRV